MLFSSFSTQHTALCLLQSGQNVVTVTVTTHCTLCISSQLLHLKFWKNDLSNKHTPSSKFSLTFSDSSRLVEVEASWHVPATSSGSCWGSLLIVENETRHFLIFLLKSPRATHRGFKTDLLIVITQNFLNTLIKTWSLVVWNFTLPVKVIRTSFKTKKQNLFLY